MTRASYEKLSVREVVFRRLLAAPPERVWKLWSELKHLERWYGPDGFTITTEEFDFREGKEWRFVMHGPGPDGVHMDNPNVVVFREVVPPKRLVYDNGWDLEDAPLDFRMEVTLEALGQHTRMTLHMTFADAAALRTAVERYGVIDGGITTLERFAVELERRRTPV